MQSIFLAPLVTILSYYALIHYAIRFYKDDLGLVGFASNKMEQAFILSIGGLLMFSAFNMFFMKHCRKQTREILCCRERRKKTFHMLMQRKSMQRNIDVNTNVN